jgi:hypothetical protein
MKVENNNQDQAIDTSPPSMMKTGIDKTQHLKYSNKKEMCAYHNNHCGYESCRYQNEHGYYDKNIELK